LFHQNQPSPGQAAVIVGDTTKVAIHVGGSSCVFFFQVLKLKENHLNQQTKSLNSKIVQKFLETLEGEPCFFFPKDDGLTGSQVGNLGVSVSPPQK